MAQKLLPGKQNRRRNRLKRFFSKRSKEQNAVIILGAAVVLLMASIATYILVNQVRSAKEIAAQAATEEAIRLQQSFEIASYEQFASSNLYFEGIKIEGIDVGGMTIEQARTAVSPHLPSYALSGDLKLTYGNSEYLLDKSSIATSVNLEETLAEAFQVARNGNYEENKAIIREIQANGRNFTLSVSYDFSQVVARVAEIAAVIDVAPQDASVFVASEEERKIGFKPAVEGVAVLKDELIQAITDAVQSGNNASIEIPVLLTPPAITEEYLSNYYKLRASASTSFKGSASERKYNIRKGAGLINGTVLKPGQVFSANDTLGVRTSSNGWKIAGAYESGATVQQAGGGVCQLSSTLYNAAVKADLEIVYRQNHSMPVSYVSQGLDATINSVGNIIDFKFKNNTVADILIFAYTSGNTLTFEIYGPPFDTDEYDEIRLSTKKLKTLPPSSEVVYILDESLEPGAEVWNVDRKDGSLWQSYKHYYKNGTEVRKEKLDQSVYKSFAGEVLVGPEPVATPVPTPAPPVATSDSNPTPIPTPTPTTVPTAVPDPTATAVPPQTDDPGEQNPTEVPENTETPLTPADP